MSFHLIGNHIKICILGLSQHPVHNVVECEKIMQKGWKNRATGATLMNADSSRSHSIFTINLEMMTADDAGEEHIRAGKLNLVDLAGSERQAKTGKGYSRKNHFPLGWHLIFHKQ